MQRGQVVEKADVYELFNRPQHAYTKQLLDARLKLQINQQINQKTKEFVCS